MKDITPKPMRCSANVFWCPALIQADDGRVWVVGDMAVIPDEVKKRIGPGEAAVLVPSDLLKDINWSGVPT